MPESITYNIDCLEYMRKLPDNFFDLAVADPPFGDAQQNNGTYNRFGGSGGRFEKYKPASDVLMSADGEPMSTHTHRAEESVTRTGGTWAEKYGKKIVAWDVAPEKEFFDELFRVSRDQVIFGANYFSLPPTRCFLVWRKTNIPINGFSMAPVEIAWTSFNRNAMVFECSSAGSKDNPRFHPCEKPVTLYRWIYQNFAKEGDKIFDPMFGSGTSRMAAYDMGLDYIGCELDETYFRLQEERFEAYTAQTKLF